MSLYYGSKKIRDYDTTGVYVGAGKTNCITYIPEDIKLELNSLNVYVNGSPTISAGVVSGFTVDNYLGILDKFNTTDTWELVSKFTTGSSFSSAQAIFHKEYTFAVQLDTTGKISIYNWGSKTTALSSSALSKNTTYWVRVVVNGSTKARSVYYSTDNSTWTAVIENQTDSGLQITSTDYPNIICGRSSYSKKNPFNGSISLPDTKIYKNGTLIWQGGTGQLTLKAGSRVYIPNGFEADEVTPKFDEVVIDSDVVVSCGNSGSRMAFLGRDGKAYDSNITYVSSGSTAPTNTGHRWYDTANNIIKEYINGSWQTSTNFGSLPFAILTADSNKVFTSIDQVFNGFGYMGSTIFALPNVKGLIPDGWNGAQYNNIEFETDRVMVITNPSNAISDLGITINQDSIARLNLNYYNYDSKNNLNYNSENNEGYFSRCIGVNYSRDANGRVTTFTPKTVKTTNDTVSVGFIYKGSELVYKGRHYESWSMPSSPSSKGYTLSGNPSSYVDRLFDKSSSTDRWGQGISNTSKYFVITFPFPVIIDSITVKQGFAGSHDDSRTYSVRFHTYPTTSGGTKEYITNQTNLNWAVDSSTNIPITSKPIARRLRCDCTMQEYGTLNEVYISGRRVL